MVKIHYHRTISIYSNRTVNNSNRTVNNFNRAIKELTVLLEYIYLICQMHFEEQRGASATYYVPITANLLAKHGK